MSKRKAVEFDPYRVILFKKKMRELLEAPWLRFYWSIDRCHVCIRPIDFQDDSVPVIVARLQNAGIELKIHRLSFGVFGSYPENERPIHDISIPLDQDALPERRQRKLKRSPHEPKSSVRLHHRDFCDLDWV